jgi:hypothetical protein
MAAAAIEQGFAAICNTVTVAQKLSQLIVTESNRL